MSEKCQFVEKKRHYPKMAVYSIIFKEIFTEWQLVADILRNYVQGESLSFCYLTFN